MPENDPIEQPVTIDLRIPPADEMDENNACLNEILKCLQETNVLLAKILAK